MSFKEDMDDLGPVLPCLVVFLLVGLGAAGILFAIAYRVAVW